jgi:hypothetical protein
MKKLWATVLTGLLGCTAIGRAADPVAPGALVPMPPVVRTTNTPPSPYAVIPTLPPVVTTTTTDEAKAPKTTTEPVTRIQPKTLNYRPAILETADPKSPEVKTSPVLQPAETKWNAAKPPALDAPNAVMKDRNAAEPQAVTTISPDLKAVAPPGSVLLPGYSESAPPCASCTACPKPCEKCGATVHAGRRWANVPATIASRTFTPSSSTCPAARVGSRWSAVTSRAASAGLAATPVRMAPPTAARFPLPHPSCCPLRTQPLSRCPPLSPRRPDGGSRPTADINACFPSSWTGPDLLAGAGSFL